MRILEIETNFSNFVTNDGVIGSLQVFVFFELEQKLFYKIFLSFKVARLFYGEVRSNEEEDQMRPEGQELGAELWLSETDLRTMFAIGTL